MKGRVTKKLNGDEPLWLIDDVIIPDMIPDDSEMVHNAEMWRNLDGWTLQILVRDKVISSKE